MAKKILIVEDEKQIVDILKFNLSREGYETITAADGPSGLKKALGEAPDLILLDIMLPGMDGFGVCRALRETDRLTPVIMLTAREEESDKVFGLELGADDYITKPFSIKELLARIKANIRRTARETQRQDAGETLNAGGISLHTGRMEVTADGSPIELSQREYELTLYMMRRMDTVVSREELMQNVWNYDYLGDLRAVDVAVRRLREKVERNPAEPVYILTRRGAGYMFSSANGPQEK